MSTPLNKKRLLPNPKDHGTKSPRTPRTAKHIKEQKGPITPSSSLTTSLKNKDTRKSTVQTPRLLKGTTPVKVSQRADTPTKRKLLSTKTEVKESQENDSFSTIILEQKQSIGENSCIIKQKMQVPSCEANDNNSSIKVAVRVRPFSER